MLRTMFLVCFFCFSTQASASLIMVSSDAYVQGGSSANQNFGNSESLLIKSDSDSNFIRKTYLQFESDNLSEIRDPVLNLTLQNPSTINAVIAVYGLVDGDSGESWSEDGITWNNAPGNNVASNGFLSNSTLLGSFFVSATAGFGSKFEFAPSSLADFLATDTNGIATFMLTSQTPLAFESPVSFLARETLNAPTLSGTVSVPIPGALLLFLSSPLCWYLTAGNCRKRDRSIAT